MEKTCMLKREILRHTAQTAIAESPVTVLLGARQVGKTTLVRQIAADWPDSAHVFDLETEGGYAALSSPELALSGLRGLVVVDEVQRMPHLFTVLRPLADRDPPPARFILLGSASPTLIKGVSESLAGRVRFVPVAGLNLVEAGLQAQGALWLRGGFPRSFLAASETASLRWRKDFITTQVERDIPQLGIQVPPETLRRFWTMLAHYHGQTWNGEELARSMGVSGKTVRHYLDILAGTYLVRVLPPWFENLGKRQTKSPKVYLRDSGLLHAFLNVSSMAALQSHPKYGASWEGFALEQMLDLAGSFQAHFWSTRQGAELDLLLERDGRRIGVEFKCADAPVMTKSMHIALQDLKLDRLLVVYPGSTSYPIHPKAVALPLADALREVMDTREEDNDE
jgi:predicted AAA+ superfamily ATPase